MPSSARSALAATAGVAAAVLLWSILVALLVWRPTGYTDHPSLGRIYRPGTYVHGIEGFSWSKINSLGMRGAEPAAQPAPGATRFLFLGDSFTEAFQVAPASSYPEVTGGLLGARGLATDVVNGGRSGASPASYIFSANWYEDNLEPDRVVIQLSDQDFAYDIFNAQGNFYLRSKANAYEAVFNREFRSANLVAQRSALVRRLIEWPLVRLAAENLRKVLGARASAPAPAGNSGSDPVLVDWIIDELAGAYGDPVILFLPTLEYEGRLTEPTDVEKLVAKSAARHGLTFVDVRGDMVSAYETQRIASHGFPNTRIPDSGAHLNAAGHEIVARRLAEALADGDGR